MPASDGGDDIVGIGDPLERLRLVVVIVEETVDGGLEVGHGSEAYQSTPFRFSYSFIGGVPWGLPLTLVHS
jgi:hypothetical protein